MGIEKFPLKSAMLLIHQTVVPLLFFLACCSLCSINIIRPYHNNKASSIFIANSFSRLFSSVFGSNSLSDRNVPAGDDFVKIDVNSFPVLTLLKERNSKTSLSHTHTNTQNRWVGNI